MGNSDYPLTDRLTALYKSKWKDFVEQMGEHMNEVYSPMFLSLNRYEPVEGESWYSEADLKVMVFGKEFGHWGKRNDSPEDVMELYQEFYHELYIDTFNRTFEDKANEHPSFEDVGPDHNLSNSDFFHFGFCDIICEICEEILMKKYPGKRAAFLWNNISKLAKTGKGSKGKAVSSKIHEIERKYLHVIPQEIEILKPDVVIFFTGLGFDKTYDNYISENFDILGEQFLDNTDEGVVKLDIANVPLAYKTHHPGTTKSWKPITTEDKLAHYRAIREDIAANIDKIFNRAK